ncbi:MAG: pyruvate formate lyase-activating protein [Microcoleaceae cyanobacterium]
MTIQQTIRCPNCGALAERWHYDQTTQTECSVCDYLMVTCAETGNVLEAYAPGTSAQYLKSVRKVISLQPLAQSVSR